MASDVYNSGIPMYITLALHSNKSYLLDFIQIHLQSIML